MGTTAETLDLATMAAAAVALPATDTERWEHFNAIARRHETRYEVVALLLFRLERESVARRIQDAVPSVKAIDPTDPPPTVADPFIEAALIRIAADYAPGGQYHAEWLRRYRTLVTRTVHVGAGARVGLSFTLQNLRAQAAIQRRVTKLTGAVTETTVQRVRAVIIQARTEGVGVSEVARRIRHDAFDSTITRQRAQTIARTEVVGALNEGAWIGTTEANVMRSKRWLSQQDGRVRESHVAAQNEGWIGIDARFGNGLLYPHEPGAPADEVIQCRCTLLYSDQSPHEARS